MIKHTSVSLLLAAAIGAATAVSQTPATKPAQQAFPTLRAAVDALVDACKNNDSAALTRMLGERYGEHMKKIDDAEERQHRRDFYERARAHLKIEEQGDAKATLLIGRELWPVPVPLVKEAGGWRFDLEAGIEEMLARRIGENELAIIELCHEYVQLQSAYAAVDSDGDEVREYAQRIVSTPGKRDGLYWESDPESHDTPSPVAALSPDLFESLRRGKPDAPYMGYHLKILTRQGAKPPGGKYGYVINGHMIAGFALLAWPTDYRESGVMTFLISHQGRLLEKDLGPDTAKLAPAMTEYDPDKSWKRVENP